MCRRAISRSSAPARRGRRVAEVDARLGSMAASRGARAPLRADGEIEAGILQVSGIRRVARRRRTAGS